MQDLLPPTTSRSSSSHQAMIGVHLFKTESLSKGVRSKLHTRDVCVNDENDDEDGERREVERRFCFFLVDLD